MNFNRRDWLRWVALGLAVDRAGTPGEALGQTGGRRAAPLKINGLKVTPIALPDPPLLFAGGCHGPYFLRNVIELTTESGIIGIAETNGGEATTEALERARRVINGRDAFAYRGFARELLDLPPACYSGIEQACLDACGKATGRRLCDLLGGPVRDPVDFAAYLFYRYAADHPTVLADPHLVASDPRRMGGHPLDAWGEVRTPDAMAALAETFRARFGFRVFKLKGGVLSPDAERTTLGMMSAGLGPKIKLRIDPNARWRTETAIRIGKTMDRLPLEYYEDPVRGQADMAEVRRATGLRMSTNMCVTRFDHLPEAMQVHPIDVLLCDLHYFGGFAGCLALGPICDVAGWAMSQHSNSHAGLTMAAMIHLGATLPQLTLPSDTHYPWLADDADIIEGPKLPIAGGQMKVPDGPGLGVAIDHDKLARAHEVYERCGMRGRDDVPLMQRLDPTWTDKLL
jgi:glucarate dehydratase